MLNTLSRAWAKVPGGNGHLERRQGRGRGAQEFRGQVLAAIA